jgi:tetratricopeptide (TPR) repeat protein
MSRPLRLARRFLLVVAILSVRALVTAEAPFAHPSDAEKIDVLTRRIEARGDDPGLYLKRGAVYSEDGHYELALEDFSKAEALTDSVVVALDVGMLKARQGDLPGAKKSLDLFLGRFPNHSRALEERARVLVAMGDTQAAVETFERLFAVTPSPNPGSYTSAARILSEQGDTKDTDRALAILDGGIVRLGMIPQLQQFAIELELQEGRTTRALERLEGLEPSLGAGPEWKVEKSELLLKLDRNREARSLLDTAARQLTQLRETPARRALAKRITGLQGTLEKGRTTEARLPSDPQ